MYFVFAIFNMPKNKKNFGKSIGPCLDENFRINIEKDLQEFKLNDDQTGLFQNLYRIVQIIPLFFFDFRTVISTHIE